MKQFRSLCRYLGNSVANQTDFVGSPSADRGIDGILRASEGAGRRDALVCSPTRRAAASQPMRAKLPQHHLDRKSEALNRAWAKYLFKPDMVICLDADTVLPPNAVGAWPRGSARKRARPQT
ncbi:glycosyl transferase family [Arthrobacter sp. Hiyo4]|nr:glycosyl transferase family [Arthrobacter sp. Hiyo4]